MNDGLKQISEYVKNISKKADRSLKRYLPPEKSVESIRDVIDADNPLKAHLNMPNAASLVLMQLNFGPRSATIGCCADCICGNTESFSSDALIDGKLYLQQTYITGSTNIYIDDIRAVRGVDYVESGANQITILTAGTRIIISYTYNLGNCTTAEFPCGFINWPVPNVFSGNALVFSDRYDRADGAIPSGGCGRYSIVTIGVDDVVSITDVNLQTFDGIANLTSLTPIVLGGGAGFVVGKSFECIVALDMSFTNWGFGFSSPNGGIASFSFTGTQLSLAVSCLVLDTSVPSIPIPIYKRVSNFSSTPFTRGDLTNVYIRMAQSELFGATIRIWNQDEEEPSGWDAQLTYNGLTNAVGLALPTISTITASAPNMQAIELWAGADTGYFEPRTRGAGYSLDTCYIRPDDGLTRFGFCTPATTEVAATSGDALARVRISSPSFVDGPQIAIGTEQEIYRWDCRRGDPQALKVKGVIRCRETGGGITSGFTAHFKTYGAALTAPSNDDSWFVGEDISSMILALDEWTNFEIIVPVTDGIASWGVDFGTSATAIAGAAERENGGVLQPNNGDVAFETDGITIQALSNIHCSAPPVCPDTQGSDARGFAELEA